VTRKRPPNLRQNSVHSFTPSSTIGIPLTKLIKEAFDRKGIEMPYPHTVEISKGEVDRRDPPIKSPSASARGRG